MAYLTPFCRKFPKNPRKKSQRSGRGGQAGWAKIPTFTENLFCMLPLPDSASYPTQPWVFPNYPLSPNPKESPDQHEIKDPAMLDSQISHLFALFLPDRAADTDPPLSWFHHHFISPTWLQITYLREICYRRWNLLSMDVNCLTCFLNENLPSLCTESWPLLSPSQSALSKRSTWTSLWADKMRAWPQCIPLPLLAWT